MRVRKPGQHGGPPSIIPTPYQLDGPQCSECPRSLVTQRSEDLVFLVSTIMSANEASGSAFSLDQMPGYLVDAVKMAQREAKAVDAAMEEAVSRA